MMADDSLDHTVLADLRLIQREGGGDIVRGLVETFLFETSPHLDALQEAAERREAEPFARKAHALNGLCRAVGASRMGSICLELERLGEFGGLARAPEPLSRLREEFDRVQHLLDAEFPGH
jgi:HPt (histidine-containing phosphotransfer) domain-containing protein